PPTPTRSPYTTLFRSLVRADLMKRLPLRAERLGIEVELTARLSQAGARIRELPISYSGRTYAEGKKITWRDGLAAFFHILRYNLDRKSTRLNSSHGSN